MKIMMLCLGNICRSPLAEALFKLKLPENFTIESRGTSALHEGQGADPRMIETAKMRGVDLTAHRAKGLKSSDLEGFDLIFCMDQDNRNNALSLASTKEQEEKIHLVLEQGQSVPDPYFGGQEGFDLVYELLDQALEKKARILIEKFG